MGISANTSGSSKRKSLRSKAVVKKLDSKSGGSSNSSSAASTMKPLSDIKEFLYNRNAKSKSLESDDKKPKIVDPKTSVITLKNGEKVPLGSLSKSSRKRFNRRLRTSQENKLLSLDKITDELVNIKKQTTFSEEPNISSDNPFDQSNMNKHEPKLSTKKGSKIIHIQESENFKKLLPSLSSNSSENGQQSLNTFKNIKEIIKLRTQNGF